MNVVGCGTKNKDLGGSSLADEIVEFNISFGCPASTHLDPV